MNKWLIFIVTVLALIVAGLFAWERIKEKDVQQAAIENPETKTTGNYKEITITEYAPPISSPNTPTAKAQAPQPLRTITTREYNINKETKPAKIPETPKNSFYLSGGAGANIMQPNNLIWTAEAGYFISSNLSVGVQYINNDTAHNVLVKATIYF